MEMIIKISEEDYQLLKNGHIPFNILAKVRNGTPLPEHHGRLKDIDAFITKVKADRKHSIYLRSWTADDVLNALDNSYAPTVIEADKKAAESDKESDNNDSKRSN